MQIAPHFCLKSTNSDYQMLLNPAQIICKSISTPLRNRWMNYANAISIQGTGRRVRNNMKIRMRHPTCICFRQSLYIFKKLFLDSFLKTSWTILNNYSLKRMKKKKPSIVKVMVHKPKRSNIWIWKAWMHLRTGDICEKNKLA